MHLAKPFEEGAVKHFRIEVTCGTDLAEEDWALGVSDRENKEVEVETEDIAMRGEGRGGQNIHHDGITRFICCNNPKQCLDAVDVLYNPAPGLPRLDAM
jgi:hypothetical protein